VLIKEHGVQALAWFSISEQTKTRLKLVLHGDEVTFQEWAKSVEIGFTSVPVLHRDSQTIYQPNTIAAFIPPQSKKKMQAIAIVKWLVSELAQVELSRHAIKDRHFCRLLGHQCRCEELPEYRVLVHPDVYGLPAART
jgi:hypothetical protein